MRNATNVVMDNYEKIMKREGLVLDYAMAVGRGDTDVVRCIVRKAEDDPDLERRLIAIDEAYCGR